MRQLLVFGLFVFLSSVSVTLAQDTDISGRYVVEGANPDGKGIYRGEVAVVRTKDTFQIRWKIGRQEYRGTGILRERSLSVVYVQPGGRPGLATYELRSNGSLLGSWTDLGSMDVGSEVWNPRDRT